ncbi:MAG TPA: hypothetical protein VF234_08855, partial [Limnochordia bacterium]
DAPPWEPLARFERPDGFACFEGERNPSVSTNVHVLEALNKAPPAPEVGRLREKAIAFLKETQGDDGCWIDKWHISPLYTTGHAVIALLDGAPELAARGLRWLVAAQNRDGSWGSPGTDEETAYAVQALAHALLRAPSSGERAVGADAMRQAIRAGAGFLTHRLECSDYPELWVGKGLYTPIHVVRSAVLSACRLAAHVLQPAAVFSRF